MRKIIYKAEDLLVLILSTPLIIYECIRYLIDRSVMFNRGFRDKLFLKKMNLIDQQHFDDFIKWNDLYHAKRKEIE